MSSFEKHYVIEPMNLDLAGQMASDLKRRLKSMNFSFDFIKRISVATYEAEINMVIHSLGGYAEAFIDSNVVMVRFIDKGPGIENLELAMTPGYSTANEWAQLHGFGAGMGLTNIANSSDKMELLSDKNGTQLTLLFYSREDC